MLRTLLLAVLLALGGCMGRMELAPPTAAAAPKPRLWVLGLGLYDESWSENDAAETVEALARRADGFEVVPVVLSYGEGGSQRRFPDASFDNIVYVTGQIARRARPGDVVLLTLSTHGGPGLLARKAPGAEAEAVDADELRAWLEPVRRLDTVVILSACFSASLFPALAAENRIVIAAARPDRTSFGCKAGAEHTVFGQALLDALAVPHRSLHAVFDAVRSEVGAMERRLGVSPPSEPQVSVGTAEAALYDAPAF